jgi:hypothetical protein
MDILDRLRDTTGIHEELIYEAADEIERLRETLRVIDKWLVTWLGESSATRKILHSYIDAALKGDE